MQYIIPSIWGAVIELRWQLVMGYWRDNGEQVLIDTEHSQKKRKEFSCFQKPYFLHSFNQVFHSYWQKDEAGIGIYFNFL